METYLTVEETAETLKVSIDSVRRWLRSGKLRGNRYGRVWRIPLSELRCTGRVSRHSDEVITPLDAVDVSEHNRSHVKHSAKWKTNEQNNNDLSASQPAQHLTEFLRLADELAPIIEVEKTTQLSSIHVSDAVLAVRCERDKETHGQ